VTASLILTLRAQFLHHGLDQGLGSFHTAQYSLEIQGRHVRIAARCAIDAVLSNHNQRVGEQVEGNRQAASLHAHHELVLLQFALSFVEYAHIQSLPEECWPVMFPVVCHPASEAGLV